MERGVTISAVITAAFGVVTFALLPVTGMVNSPTYSVFFLWLAMTATVVACHIFWQTIKLAASGQASPAATLLARFDRKQAAFVGLGTLLLALNLTIFCIMKPQLGQLVDFTADPLLADIDHLLFGADPWRLIGWFNHPYLSNIYHRGWFLWLAFVIFFLLNMPKSEEKDRLLVSYVMLWSIFGPLVHLALPAAGPVFYDELGLGNRFVELRQSGRTDAVAKYLWDGYANKVFNPAGGISAMPSLHLATMFWSIIAVRNTRWLAFGIAFTAYIFLGSVAIGWHYAVDGIVGGIGAVGCYALTGVLFRRPISVAVPELSDAAGAAPETA